MTAMTPEEKFELINRNLQEVLGADQIKQILAQRDLNLYWGTAPTGKPHIGYFVPMTKIADFLKAGCHVTILFANLHAYLDNMKAPWDQLELRTKYYEATIKAMLTSIGVPLDKLKFVVGTSYQLSQEYSLDVYKMLAITTEHDAKKAGAEVVKQAASPLMSALVYPLLQALDEEYLKVDAQFGGVDQRKIFTFAEKYMPNLGYKKRAHLMNPMVAGLRGSKMSASDPDSKVDLLDDAKTVARKIKKAFCEEGNVDDNPLLEFLKVVVFPARSLTDPTYKFVVKRPEKFGGDIVFDSYQQIEDAFREKKLHPVDLKTGTADAINALLEPIRTTFKDEALIQLSKDAYGDAQAAAKQIKKPVQNSAEPDVENISKLDIRVGRIVDIKLHPDAESLYVEQIDLGEPTGPRTIVSGLAKHIPLSELQNRTVLVLTNLKPSKLRGIESNGMVLAASTSDNTTVELLDPPSEASVGDHVSFEGFDYAPVPILNPKKDVWKKCAGEMKVDGSGVAVFRNVPFVVGGGAVKARSLKDALIG
ncbi:tyrosine-tRNA ligase [Spizellomyces punctatus DAOM BR117]|uniref:Tyrosine--tRNA ligase n=1 Tax=Spizellomyces punctatus (strain DAOM BR117) TaxID=645134 RepID=A0A0L0HAD1_SPIPD|nr:tyrosine-tRNA ligase [Spizellomyces punctatus DAOM BR117]KNC97864.1 tyrosine-tRNA ligase [Spizellomyces punctatus DAOM BR117]|eukprot:XP_016605904.1 tyrosine-tRNA ligase [Spizellomyces punctatus DAOM BR117]